MPTLARITINDAAGTPVAHNFDPVILQGGTAKWADRSPSIPSGFRTISREVAAPVGSRSTYKVTDGFYMPEVAEVDGSDKVVRYSSGKLELNIHPESTLQERKDLHAYLTNWLANSDVKNSIFYLEPFF